MNKNLAKIITICVLAVVIPVAVIVTAVCLSSAVEYSLTLAVKGFVENAGEYTITVNGENYEEPVKFLKNKDITVELTSTGYNFEGWYNGESISEADEAVSETAKYTFKLTGNTTLTAVVDLIKFNVSYDGADAEVAYGSSLKAMPALDANNYAFAGWYYTDASGDHMVNSSAELANVTANEDGKIELHAKKIATYKVSYDGVPAEGRLLEGANLAGAEKAVLANGEKFVSWKRDETVVTKANFGGVPNADNAPIALVSNKEAVKYTVIYNYATPETAENVAYGAELAEVDTEKLANGYVADGGWLVEGDETVYTTATFAGHEHEDATITLNPKQRIDNFYAFNETYSKVTINPQFSQYVYDEEGDALVSSENIMTITINNDIFNEDGSYKNDDKDISKIKLIDELAGNELTTVYDENGNELKVDRFIANGTSISKDCKVKEFIEAYNGNFEYGTQISINVIIVYVAA